MWLEDYAHLAAHRKQFGEHDPFGDVDQIVGVRATQLADSQHPGPLQGACVRVNKYLKTSPGDASRTHVGHSRSSLAIRLTE